jgi:MFS family permease
LTVPILAIAVVIRVFSGFMFAAITTSTNTNAADAIPKSRFGEGIGILGTANTIANALAPALGLALIASFGFPSLFVASGALMLLVFLLERGLKYRPINKSKSERAKFELKTLFNKDAIPASVVMFFTAAPFGGAMAFIAIFAELYDVGSGGLFFAINAVGTGSTRIFAGRIVDSKGEKPLIVFANLNMLGALAMLQLNSSLGFYLSGLLFGIAFGVAIPAMQTMSMRIVPTEKRGAATGTFLCGFDLSMSAGGLVAGALVTLMEYRQMFAWLSVFTLISFALYFFWAAKSPSAFKKSAM